MRCGIGCRYRYPVPRYASCGASYAICNMLAPVGFAIRNSSPELEAILGHGTY